ncbi:hypothetical protein DL762_003150 [Monosporascus cannonballus]|uniref:CTP synthase n=1 Tax=Monosporascus cannonballus TaxID=155416 RepID=A0ABY0HC12_9PEZI|nr:hypothetical protein DL762_003150 [Monosporascus cannonballus]RYO99004.1 hypothetical protein DL763_001809 [Monosporascus cannonballus]
MRYALVSGGVISGVGKGIIASSTGLLLKSLGLRISCIKIDPYVSVDAGLMAPAEHGECLRNTYLPYAIGGNYERYLGLTLTGDNNITTGKIYLEVLQKERRGGYLGKTVQIVPHVVDMILDWIKRVAEVPVDGSGEEPDVCIIELCRGTVGDIENALTQLRHEAGSDNFLSIFVSYVPLVHGEQKTKPTQHAVKTVRSHGLIPDLVEVEQVVVIRDMPTVYQVPLLLREQSLVPLLQSKLNLGGLSIPPSAVAAGAKLWETWTSVVTKTFDPTVDIALVGKYVQHHDAYLSVEKSLEHSCMRIGRNLNICWIDSKHLEPKTQAEEPEKYQAAWDQPKTASGILVPGGFGVRGVEGMMLASRWARENGTPFLGVCLGFQTTVIQYARDKCSISGANSEEFYAGANDHVIIHMAEVIEERHRHRYEVNLQYVERLIKAGLHFIGKDTKGERMGVFELKDHPYFVGAQFHAEYQSRVLNPSKPYLGFVAASAGCLHEVIREQGLAASNLTNGVNGGNHF